MRKLKFEYRNGDLNFKNAGFGEFAGSRGCRDFNHLLNERKICSLS